MATYRCDLGHDFADRTGAVGDEYYGPGGLRNALTGDGAATALAAGDTIYLKGTGDYSRLVYLTVDLDKSGTWVIGDALQDDDVDWAGVLVYISATLVVLQTNSGSDGDVVLITDDLVNFTRSDSIPAENVTAKAVPGLLTTGAASGDTSTGQISVVGCDASWVARNGQATLDVTDCDNGITISAAIDYWTLEYLTVDGSDGIGLNGNGKNSCDHWCIRYCKFSNHGGNGVHGLYIYYAKCFECIFSGNGGSGYQYPLTYAHFDHCVFADNTAYGIQTSYSGTVITKSLFYGNGSGDIDVTDKVQFILGNVLDGTAGGGDGVSLGAGDIGNSIMRNRIVNHAAYGLDFAVSADGTTIEDYNVFYGNASGDLNGGVSGRHSYGEETNHISDPSDDGLDANYQVETGKEHRSTEIVLNWDGA